MAIIFMVKLAEFLSRTNYTYSGGMSIYMKN